MLTSQTIGKTKVYFFSDGKFSVNGVDYVITSYGPKSTVGNRKDWEWEYSYKRLDTNESYVTNEQVLIQKLLKQQAK